MEHLIKKDNFSLNEKSSYKEQYIHALCNFNTVTVLIESLKIHKS